MTYYHGTGAELAVITKIAGIFENRMGRSVSVDDDNPIIIKADEIIWSKRIMYAYFT